MSADERCPVCGSGDMLTLPPGWQRYVEAGWKVAIVGCGNPWHYLFPTEPPPPAETPLGDLIDASGYADVD